MKVLRQGRLAFNFWVLYTLNPKPYIGVLLGVFIKRIAFSGGYNNSKPKSFDSFFGAIRV